MLNIREKVLLLFATAPFGFEATSVELARKFGANRRAMLTCLYRLRDRGVLEQTGRGKQLYRVGPALRQELGADE